MGVMAPIAGYNLYDNNENDDDDKDHAETQAFVLFHIIAGHKTIVIDDFFLRKRAARYEGNVYIISLKDPEHQIRPYIFQGPFR